MYKILSIKIPLILFLALYSGSSITHENINHNIDASSGDKCVEPTDVMRAQHHIFINHQSMWKVFFLRNSRTVQS